MLPTADFRLVQSAKCLYLSKSWRYSIAKPGWVNLCGAVAGEMRRQRSASTNEQKCCCACCMPRRNWLPLYEEFTIASGEHLCWLTWKPDAPWGSTDSSTLVADNQHFCRTVPLDSFLAGTLTKIATLSDITGLQGSIEPAVPGFVDAAMEVRQYG